MVNSKETQPLSPLDVFFDQTVGVALPLPVVLRSLYGPLIFQEDFQRPEIFANYVSTIDGVVTLGVPGVAGGGEISGYNAQDHMLMGLLRAVSDAVIIGAGSLSASPNHLWTPGYIYPALEAEYLELRNNLKLPPAPLTVIVTSRGEINTELPVFQSVAIPVMVVTTQQGADRISEKGIAEWVQIRALQSTGLLRIEDIIQVIRDGVAGRRYLVEGGPHLLSQFFASKCLDELFLTVAPQVAGRVDGLNRMGLVAGQAFAPKNPIWGRLLSIRKGGDHLFLRYAFPTGLEPKDGAQ